jgi:nucleoside recognition membrane protein YjiH
MNSDITKQIIGGIVRNALTSLFTLLVAKGWLSSSDMPSSVTITLMAGGIAGVVVTVSWSIYHKLLERLKLNVALQLSPDATDKTVDTVVAATPATSVIQNKPDPVALAQAKL